MLQKKKEVVAKLHSSPNLTRQASFATTSKVKRPVFLLEILIGLSLLSILLWALFSFLSSSAKMDQRLERASLALLERQNLMQSLNSILTEVSEDAPLYMELVEKEKEPSLIAHFDHGIDPDPAFSGLCLARIYLDEDQLKLAIWPEKKEKASVREQILLPNVGAFAFRFLTKKPDGSIIWASERSKETDTPLPSIVRLDLWQKGTNTSEEPLSFAFFLPSKYPPIVYSGHKRKR